MSKVKFKKGIYEDLRNAAPEDGVFYLTTDTNELFVGTESEIKPVGCKYYEFLEVDVLSGGSVNVSTVNTNSLTAYSDGVITVDSSMIFKSGLACNQLTYNSESGDYTINVTGNLALYESGDVSADYLIARKHLKVNNAYIVDDTLFAPSGISFANLGSEVSSDLLNSIVKDITFADGTIHLNNNVQIDGSLYIKDGSISATEFSGDGGGLTNLNASNIEDGTLSEDRLPTIPITKGGTGATTAATARTNLGITPANIGAALATHNHNASDINEGTLDASRLPTSGVTSDTYGPASDVTGSNNETIDVPQITVDIYGRITSISNKRYTSKNTEYSSATSNKLGLVYDTPNNPPTNNNYCRTPVHVENGYMYAYTPSFALGRIGFTGKDKQENTVNGYIQYITRNTNFWIDSRTQTTPEARVAYAVEHYDEIEPIRLVIIDGDYNIESEYLASKFANSGGWLDTGHFGYHLYRSTGLGHIEDEVHKLIDITDCKTFKIGSMSSAVNKSGGWYLN